MLPGDLAVNLRAVLLESTREQGEIIFHDNWLLAFESEEHVMRFCEENRLRWACVLYGAPGYHRLHVFYNDDFWPETIIDESNFSPGET